MKDHKQEHKFLIYLLGEYNNVIVMNNTRVSFPNTSLEYSQYFFTQCVTLNFGRNISDVRDPVNKVHILDYCSNCM